jgi:glycosyltransferase involved in cell wall biosynthesis
MIIEPNFINLKVLYRTDTTIAIFISAWIHDATLFTKTEMLFNKIRSHYKNVHVFLIPWWYRDGVDHYKVMEIYATNVTILANSIDEDIFYRRHKLNSIYCNQNCWLDASIFNIMPREKEYDLVINANNSEWKNHHLLAEINKKYKTLFITYNTSNNDLQRYNPACILNEIRTYRVVEELNKCRVGLALSTKEGSCYASTEYLLCGLPVISTKSVGGRQVWYDNSNSIVVNPSGLELDKAIEAVLKNIDTFNSADIRNNCIMKQQMFRTIFAKQMQKILPGANVQSIIDKAFTHKMLNHVKVDNITLDYIINHEI